MNSRAVQEPEAWFAFGGGSLYIDGDAIWGSADYYYGFQFRLHSHSSGYLLNNNSRGNFIGVSGGTLTFGGGDYTQKLTVSTDEWHILYFLPSEKQIQIDGNIFPFGGQPFGAIPYFVYHLNYADVGAIIVGNSSIETESAALVPNEDPLGYKDTTYGSFYSFSGTGDVEYVISGEEPVTETGWITVNPTAGTGTTVVTLTAGNYTGKVERRTSFRIEGVHGTVVYLTAYQEAFEPLIELNPVSLSFSQTGGTQALSVSSNVEWTAEAPVWVELSASSGTSGETQITVSTENYTGDTALNGSIVFKYNNSVVATVSVSQMVEASENYLWFDNVGTEPETIFISSGANLQYSLNDQDWQSDPIEISPGQRVYAKGTLNPFDSRHNEFEGISQPTNVGGFLSNKNGDHYRWLFENSKLFSSEKLNLSKIELKAEILTGMYANCILLETPPELPAATELPKECYGSMFKGCTSLTTAPELPYMTLADNCYLFMFQGCTSLTTAPELPATTLAKWCYLGMFSGCTSLTTAPELPATTLGKRCYNQMFKGCTSLTTAPSVLPATTLANDCYRDMFEGCTSLTTAPELPATTLDGYCYYEMFSECTSLTTAPELSATTLDIGCYEGMFKGCTSLTTAPELPATTLARSCYESMFSGCTSLNYLKMNALENVNNDTVAEMLRDVSPTGTLVIPSAATYSDEDLREWTGMPDGWTIQRQ